MGFESVCFSLRYCRGDIPVFFRKICEKYDCDEKPIMPLYITIERLELSNSGFHQVIDGGCSNILRKRM